MTPKLFLTTTPRRPSQANKRDIKQTNGTLPPLWMEANTKRFGLACLCHCCLWLAQTSSKQPHPQRATTTLQTTTPSKQKNIPPSIFEGPLPPYFFDTPSLPLKKYTPPDKKTAGILLPAINTHIQVKTIMSFSFLRCPPYLQIASKLN